MMKKLTTFLLLVIATFALAQDIKVTTKDNDLKLSAIPYYSYGKGLGITSPDSIFQFNIRFRMQNRTSYLDGDTENMEPAFGGEVRRLRLRFDGYVGDPRFLYAIQLSFAPGDVGEIEEGENLNVIRDAVFFYRPNKNWLIGFGQTKLPGNRQRVNSSGALQLTDRSINNNRFTLDRDFGVQVFQLNEFQDKFSYNFKGAISTGEGRNNTKKPDNGLAYTGKVELFPFGSFTKDGTYFEGDVIRETKPKLLLSGAYQFNDDSRKTQGQTGKPLFENKDTQTVLLDAMFKYNGWSFQTAYMTRISNDPITYNPDDLTAIQYVFTGFGNDYQLSYLFPSNYELIGKYSYQKPHDDIRAFAPDVNQYAIGVTKYIWEHAFKLQGEVSFDTSTYLDGSKADTWFIRFQVEIGI